MTPKIVQRDKALRMANGRRMQLVELRRDMRAGRVTLAEIMVDPPDLLEHVACIDVVRMNYSRVKATPWMERLGRLAVADGINLMMPLGRASARTREWIAENAAWHVKSCRDTTRLTVELTR